MENMNANQAPKSVGISNTREWTSNDPTEIKAVQDALRPFFSR